MTRYPAGISIKVALATLALLAIPNAFAQDAPAEPYCPVAKPNPIPDGLGLTFSADAQITLEQRREELKQAAQKPVEELPARALRWLIHQVDKPFELRDAALETLFMWDVPWFVDDVTGMLEDAPQPEKWRAHMARILALYQGRNFDKESYQALEKAAASKDPVVRKSALLELAGLCREYRYPHTNPDRHRKQIELVGAALQDADASVQETAIRAAGIAGLKEHVGPVEQAAADAQRPQAQRLAALEALKTLARPGSLAAVDACVAVQELKAAAEAARPYVLVARLTSADAAERAGAYAALDELGAAAREALWTALLQPEQPALVLVKALLAKKMALQYALPPLDHTLVTGMGGDPAKNKPGHPHVRINKEQRIIVVDADFCLESGPLEYLVVCKGENAKLHETALALDCLPMDLVYALFAAKYTYVGELRDEGKVKLPKGAGVMLSIEFEFVEPAPAGEVRKRIRVPAETLVWNSRTGKPMRRAPWAFTGSQMVKDPNTGKDVLMAVIEKSVAAIMADPNALLNTPLDTAEKANVGQDREGAFYEVNRAFMPKKGTKCMLILEPWTGDELTSADVTDTNQEPKTLEKEKQTP